ncbi:MAG: hypothetical protein PHR77_10125 [Kiritimatiellae bacterium]|nr:hypothetical protein [Kiritimatiellia bacterium]MDD5522606.1 hypothetical protein [Kiritimatiellia bacterium]
MVSAYDKKVISYNLTNPIYLMMRVVNFRGISKFFFSGVAELGGDPNWERFTILNGPGGGMARPPVPLPQEHVPESVTRP